MKFCQKTTINEVSKLFAKATDIAIFAHTRPDGDAVGACVALRLALKKLGKNAEIFARSSFEQDELFKRIIADRKEMLSAITCNKK